MNLGKRRRSPSLVDRLFDCCQKKLVREKPEAIHVRDLSTLKDQSLLRHSVRSTNLEDHVNYFQHKRGDWASPPAKDRTDWIDFNVPSPVLADSIFEVSEIRENRPAQIQGFDDEKKTVNTTSNDSQRKRIVEEGGRTEENHRQHRDTPSAQTFGGLDRSSRFKTPATVPSSHSKQTIISSRDEEQGRPKSHYQHQFNPATPMDELPGPPVVGAHQKTEQKKTHANTEPKTYHIPPRTPLDFDSYLALAEPRKFYLVRHLGRGLFVKFTEKHLTTPNTLYAQGKKTPIPKDMDPSVTKYFPKRYTLFSRFDEGIKMDTVGWYSVTPEIVARYTAQRLSYPNIIDFFSGVGGNSIQFALNGSNVTAVELNRERLEISRHNASVYQVEEYINFINKDVLKYGENTSTKNITHGAEGKNEITTADAVFLSPPWGGTEYSGHSYYSMFTQISPNMRDVLSKALTLSRRICVHLPRNTVVSELVVLFSMLAAEHREKFRDSMPLPPTLEVEKVYMGQNLKCIQVYFGDFKELTGKDLTEAVIKYLVEDLDLDEYDLKTWETELRDLLEGMETVDAAALITEFGHDKSTGARHGNYPRLKLFIEQLSAILGGEKDLVKKFMKSKVFRNLKPKEYFVSKLVIDLESQKPEAGEFEEDKRKPSKNEQTRKEIEAEVMLEKVEHEIKEEEIDESDDEEGYVSENEQDEFHGKNPGTSAKMSSRKRSNKHKELKNQRQAVNREKKRLIDSLEL